MLRRKIVPDGERKEDNHFVGLRSDQVGAEHVVRFSIHHHLVSICGFRGLSCGKPSGGLLRLHAKLKLTLTRLRLR